MKIFLTAVKLDNDGSCIECGAEGTNLGADAACETCTTPDVNGVEYAGYTFDVFVSEQGHLGFTVYEKGKDGDDDDAKSVDIFVSPDTEKVESI